MRVIYPGPFTTVQDNGRYGHQSEGFIVSGCADSESMKIANILCGNDPCCGVLEMTLAGMCVQFMCDTVIAGFRRRYRSVYKRKARGNEQSVFSPRRLILYVVGLGERHQSISCGIGRL